MTATPTTPQSGAQWDDPAPIRPRPDVPSGPSYCCFLKAGGDYCDCAEFEAQLDAALANPIVFGRAA